MEVEFKLDAFQGPLDLLLHLITKHKLNICDIEISLLLEQYLEYMNQLDEQDYESAGEFLEMAARLIYIKTVSLLPQPEEAQDLKKDLEGQIIEYSICKYAAQKLRELYVGNDIFVREPMGIIVDKTYTRVHEPQVIYDAFMGISAKSRNSKPLRADMFSPIVSHKIVSVTSKIIFVLKKLYKTGVYKMSGLYDGVTDKSEKVATFLAILELTKSGRIYLNDDNTEIRFIKKEKNNRRKENVDENFVDDKSLETTEIASNDLDENSVSVISDSNEENSSITHDDEEVEDVKSEIKSEIKVSTERIYIPQVVVSNIVDLSESVVEHIDNVSNDLPDNFADKEISDNIDVTDDSMSEIVDDQISDVNKEMLEIIQLADFTEPPMDIFKPNYWDKRKYYWGKTPLGQNGRNNYWYYG